MYVANLKIGERYENLRKTISIIIVNENIEQFREILKKCKKQRKKIQVLFITFCKI